MEAGQQSNEDGDMAEALRLMESALVLLDRAGRASDVAAHLDLAIHRLKADKAPMTPDPLHFVVFDIEGEGLPSEVELPVPRDVYESDDETALDRFIKGELEKRHGTQPTNYTFDCEEC